jgi:hypothetical protein
MLQLTPACRLLSPLSRHAKGKNGAAMAAHRIDAASR